MEQLTFSGFIIEKSFREDDSIFITGYDEPLVELLSEISEKNVSVRYWISDKELSKNELIESNVRSLSGAGDAEYEARYSDYTGYLWTDQKLEIGGHSLLGELSDYIGKFIYLEIDIHD